MRSAAERAGFTSEEIERARRYHRPLYLAFGADLVLSLTVLALLAFGRPGDALFRLVEDLPRSAATLAFTALVVLAGFLVRLPLTFWRSHVRERRWGFSTQTAAGWLGDRAKALAVVLVLTGGVMVGFVAIADALPRAWPLAAAAGGGGLVLLLSFVAPLVLEPLFNRFTPLADETLASDLRALSERVGVPVRDVLVSDASRRTRKQNAYVSGLGRTRRVVLFDTLLAGGQPRGVALVVAHELGHRALRHVAKGTALGMAGMGAAVVLLWLVLRSPAVLAAAGAAGPGDPRVVPLVLLAVGVLEAMAMPLGNLVSRRWERAADRFSLRATGDARVFEEAHRTLALSNLSDLDPPRPVYLLAFTHPTAPERMEMARGGVRFSPRGRRPARSGPTTA